MKGDKKTIDILNDLLAGELAAVDQYLIHGEMYADMGFQRLAEHSFHESDHERVHARALIRRILNDDKEVRVHTEPWMDNVRQLLSGGVRERNVRAAYGEQPTDD